MTECRPPVARAFHQEARWLLSRLSSDIRARLEPLGAHTRVYRATPPRLAGVLALLRPMIVRPIRNANLRTLAMMKQYLEHEGRACMLQGQASAVTPANPRSTDAKRTAFI